MTPSHARPDRSGGSAPSRPVAPRSLRGTVAALALLVVTGIGCAACTSGSAQPTAGSTSASSTPSSGASSSRTGDPGDTPSGTVSRPADPVASASPTPVQRNGSEPTPTVTPQKAGAFSSTAPVTYPDGVELTVTGVTQSVESGNGPGMFPGRPLTEISLTLTNRSATPIDLDQVVVTTTYGSPARTATAVYNDPKAKDFAGTVAPGSSASATYVFSIPTAQLSDVTSYVDFDGTHVAARFQGAVR